MSPITVPALTPSVLVTALALAVTATTTQANSAPIKLQQRQSFFRCNGWGAGCSNWDYVFRAPTYSSRSEPQLTVIRNVQPSQPGPPRRQTSSHHNYDLRFLFTSGPQWSANGKRQAPASKDHVFTLRNIFKGIPV